MVTIVAKLMVTVIALPRLVETNVNYAFYRLDCPIANCEWYYEWLGDGETDRAYLSLRGHRSREHGTMTDREWLEIALAPEDNECYNPGALF